MSVLKFIRIHVIVCNPTHSVLKLYGLTFHCTTTPKPEHVYCLAAVFLAKQRLEKKNKDEKLVSRKIHQKFRGKLCYLYVLGATDCPQPPVRWHLVCPKRKLTESWTEYIVPSILLEWTSERRMSVLSFFPLKNESSFSAGDRRVVALTSVSIKKEGALRSSD